MEMMILALTAALVALWQWARRRRMQRDVEDYAARLDQAVNALLAGEPLSARIAAEDDLWGHTPAAAGESDRARAGGAEC